jgi:hypothetical protein
VGCCTFKRKYPVPKIETMTMREVRVQRLPKSMRQAKVKPKPIAVNMTTTNEMKTEPKIQTNN